MTLKASLLFFPSIDNLIVLRSQIEDLLVSQILAKAFQTFAFSPFIKTPALTTEIWTDCSLRNCSEALHAEVIQVNFYSNDHWLVFSLSNYICATV